MKTELDKVKVFQKIFNQQVQDKPSLSKNGIFRYSLMKEENDEYLEAVQNGDLVEIADALGDQLYILCGTILDHGMQHVIEKVFNEIHRSNMSKLGEDGKPIYREDGKVLKGPGYSKPDLKFILENE